MTPHSNSRLEFIERSKGFAIVLVVLAHLVQYGTLDSPAWYDLLKYDIYKFHMPLFMFLSGYVFFHTRSHERALADFGVYVTKRANRLLVPFIAMGLVMIAGKLLADRFLYVDQSPPGIAQALLQLVHHTESSPVRSIWYLFVLFVYATATPWLLKLTGGRIWPLVAAGLALFFLEIPDEFYANRVARYFFFFIVAGLFVVPKPSMPFGSLPLRMTLAALFLIIVLQPIPMPLAMSLSGLAACIAVPSLLSSLSGPPARFLAWIGENSMVIYLFNTIFIGLSKALYLKVLPYHGFWFPVLLGFTFLAGLFLPILLRMASRRIGVPRTVIGYIS
jgi:fucose 4-O-acetylase-like acetyltransferase